MDEARRRYRRSRRYAPVECRCCASQIIQGAPRVAVAIFGFLFFDIVLLQDVAPAQAGVGELGFIAMARP